MVLFSLPFAQVISEDEDLYSRENSGENSQRLVYNYILRGDSIGDSTHHNYYAPTEQSRAKVPRESDSSGNNGGSYSQEISNKGKAYNGEVNSYSGAGNYQNPGISQSPNYRDHMYSGKSLPPSNDQLEHNRLDNGNAGFGEYVHKSSIPSESSGLSYTNGLNNGFAHGGSVSTSFDHGGGPPFNGLSLDHSGPSFSHNGEQSFGHGSGSVFNHGGLSNFGSGSTFGHGRGLSFGGSTGGGYNYGSGGDTGGYHQTPIIHKSIYVHVAPPEHEEVPRQKIILPKVAPKKNYQIVFIKAPTPPPPSVPVIPPFPTQSDKTLIYVLHPKPEEAPPIHIPAPPESAPIKPEVYFIRYKTKGNTDDEDDDFGGYHRRYGRDDSDLDEANDDPDTENKNSSAETDMPPTEYGERITTDHIDNSGESSNIRPRYTTERGKNAH